MDYRHRPPAVRMVNTAGRALERVGLEPVSLSLDSVLDAARRRTNLRDFVDLDFVGPLKILLHSYETESTPNLVGRLAARSYLVELLTNRLLLQRDRAADPGVAEQQIRAPVFITGLPRTGSTLLHGLMAQDPANRTPRTWEVMFPSPLSRTGGDAPDRRFARAVARLRWVDRLAPAFKTVHPLGARLPQECIAITTHAFQSIQFHTTHNVPAYQVWLDASDLTPAYAYHRRFLQHLQRTAEAQRWVLKAPAHVFGLDALLRVYPDARIVWTHRDPVRVTGSIASHGAILRAAFSDRIDAHAIAATWARIWAEGIERAMVVRGRVGEDGFVDLFYDDLIRDPLAAVAALYERLGWELTPAAEAAMQRFLDANPKDKHGEHRYTLAQFGLDEDRVTEYFSTYHAHFPANR